MPSKRDVAIGRFVQVYDPAIHDQRAFDMAVFGATNEQIARMFGIDVQTIYDWKNLHPSFADHLEKGKMPANAMVAGSLFRSAMGYDYVEEAVTKIRNAEGGEEIVVTKVLKHMPAKEVAQIFFLANRARDLWQRNPAPNPEKPAEQHRRDYAKIPTEKLKEVRNLLLAAGEEKLPEKGAMN